MAKFWALTLKFNLIILKIIIEVDAKFIVDILTSCSNMRLIATCTMPEYLIADFYFNIF